MLVIVGDAETDREYAEELRHLADSRVRFIPFISDTGELFGILSKARVFVFPSTIEAMSMVLMEAASLGAPIVCSDIPANRAALSERAVYFRAGDPDDLYRKLSWVITHREEMKEMGRKARAWVTGRFSWDVIAKEYDHLYGSLLQKS
jgi:glycosyltransferase involved in cell wall biosynthesis